jgi:hypothetical protein
MRLLATVEGQASLPIGVGQVPILSACASGAAFSERLLYRAFSTKFRRIRNPTPWLFSG